MTAEALPKSFNFYILQHRRPPSSPETTAPPLRARPSPIEVTDPHPPNLSEPALAMAESKAPEATAPITRTNKPLSEALLNEKVRSSRTEDGSRGGEETRWCWRTES